MSYFTTDGYKYLQAGSGVIPASGDFTVSVTAKLAASYDPRYGEIIGQGKSVPDNSTPTVGFYLGYVGEIGGGINYLTL
ncbi:MAG: hypothetical protein RL564_1277 [Pseudomonadota bacterium]|jgi:hypothetical protein